MDGSKGNIDPVFKDLAPGGDPDQDPTLEKIRILKEKGYTLRQISDEVKLSKETIRSRLIEMGIPTGRGDKETSTRPRDFQPVLFFDDETIAHLISFPFSYMAKRQGDFWLLSKDEEKQISVLANKVSSKWLPRWLINYSEEISLASFLFAVIYPRWLMSKAIIDSQNKQAEIGKGVDVSPTPSGLADVQPVS